MNTDFIKGVIVPIITVIDEDEKIDEAAMRAQVDYVINGGLHGSLLLVPTASFTGSKKRKWSADLRSW